ncbi:MAG: response regulator [Pseudomonadales bacterium]|nr:response regulator [Pseudomonadales bacterium]
MKTSGVWQYLFPFDSVSDSKVVAFDSATRAQVNSILKKLPLILLSDMVVGTYLFVALLLITDSWLPAIWYGILASTCLARGLFVYGNDRNPRIFLNTLKARWYFVFSGALVGGFVWSCIWFFLPPETGFVEYGLVVLWQCGVLAGAAASLSIIRKVYLAFIASPVIVTFVFLYFDSSGAAALLGGAFLSYVFFIVPLGLHIGNELNHGIFLGLTNTNLEKEIKQDRRKLKHQETQLVEQNLREKGLISEKILADKKLRAAAEERLLLLESIEEGIFGINSIGKVTFVNPSALNLLGYNEDDIVGERASKLILRRGVDADVYIECSNAMTNCYQKGIASTGVYSKFIGKEGKTLPVRFSCWPISKEGRIIGAVVSFSDITKQKEMEELLIQSQKMEAMGRITGGVSHDFNNLLTVIMGNLQFLRKQAGANQSMLELISKIMNAARSGADLVNRLLGFSKDQKLTLESYDINGLLLEIEGFLERILGENIVLEFSLSDEECFAKTDSTQLQNAILNLCVNARDAMHSGGKLNISANKIRPDWAPLATKTGAEYIELTVQDNGIGMSDEVQSQIFEPFFTTKDTDKGSGLGLSTVYGFLQQSGGYITVSSEIGKGTVFKMYVQATNSTEKSEDVVALVSSGVKYQGTILVVEDDDNVRSVAAQMLVDAGFEVVTAKDGKSGLQQFKNHPEIDLVFSDIIMPGGMTGIEMAKRILRKRPNAPILLATGYTEKVLKDSIPKSGNVICVSKPYDTNELPKVAHSLIDKVAS